MKSGPLIFVGVTSWRLLNLTTSVWVYEYNVHLILTLITLMSSIHWMSARQNRSRVRQALSSSRPKHDGLDGQRLLDSIAIGLVTLFVVLIVALQTAKLLVSRSDGYAFVENTVSNSQSVREKVGRVSFVTIMHGFNFYYSFKGPERTLKTNLLLIGEDGQVQVDVRAVKEQNLWTIDEMEVVE